MTTRRWSLYRDLAPLRTPDYLGDVTAPTKADAIAAGEQLHGARVLAMPSSRRGTKTPDQVFARSLGARPRRPQAPPTDLTASET